MYGTTVLPPYCCSQSKPYGNVEIFFVSISVLYLDWRHLGMPTARAPNLCCSQIGAKIIHAVFWTKSTAAAFQKHGSSILCDSCHQLTLSTLSRMRLQFSMVFHSGSWAACSSLFLSHCVYVSVYAIYLCHMCVVHRQ